MTAGIQDNGESANKARGESSAVQQGIATGTAWIGLSAISIQVLQIIQIAALSRFLSPSDFGLMAMASAIVGLAALPCEAGIGIPVVQRKDVAGDFFSSVYWSTLAVGAGEFLVVALSGPLFNWVFQEPKLSSFILWAALPLLIAPFGLPLQWMMERNLEFRLLGRIETASAVIGICSGITAAFGSWGVYSLVASSVANSVAKAGFLALARFRVWRPSLRFRRKDFNGMFGLGLNHLGQRMTNFVSGNVDDLLIGRFLGAEVLGYYSIALNLAFLPSSRVNGVVGRVALPLLSRLQQDLLNLRGAYLRIHDYACSLTFPMQVGLWVTAPTTVAVLYGSAWSSCAPLLQILALGGIARCAAGTVGPLLIARGRTQLGFAWSVLVLIVQAVGIYCGVKTGSIQVVALFAAGIMVLLALLTYLLLVRNLLGPCIIQYVQSMLTAAGITVLMGAAVWFVACIDAKLHSVARLALEVSSGILVYVGLTICVRPSLLVDLMVIRGRKQA